MIFSENVHYRPTNRLFDLDCVPESGGTFTFDLLVCIFIYTILKKCCLSKACAFLVR